MTHFKVLISFIIFISVTITSSSVAAKKYGNDFDDDDKQYKKIKVQLGPRPFYLVNDMDEGPLKNELLKCRKKIKKYKASDFSIGHRGAAMQFPEHTLESYIAAAETGAGILECDVTFTKDRELVCRHSQCDLHRTTNILETSLASRCEVPFTPAVFEDAKLINPATAKCCTSSITLNEFKTLEGKMAAGNKEALTVAEYLHVTPSRRNDLHTQNGTLLSHAESIELFKALNVKMIPELKPPSVEMPFEGEYSQEDYAQQMIEEYIQAGVKPKSVFAQSFNLDDVLYWLENEPEFGRQAVFLDGRYSDPDFDFRNSETWKPGMKELANMGILYLAPPFWMLIDTDEAMKIVPSDYASKASLNGLKLITWTLERSGLLSDGGGWYYQSVTPVINSDGDMLTVLDVLAKQVGVKGVFSDWPATVTFYANCKGL